MKTTLEKLNIIIVSIDKFLMAMYLLAIFGIIAVYPMVRAINLSESNFFIWALISLFGFRFSYLVFGFFREYLGL